MSFIIKHDSLSIHYSLPETGTDFQKFSHYIERLTGKKTNTLIYRFVDAEGDLTFIKDEWDFEYFIENCQLGDMTLEVVIKGSIAEIIKSSDLHTDNSNLVVEENTAEDIVHEHKKPAHEHKQVHNEQFVQTEEPLERIDHMEIGMGMGGMDNSFSMCEFDHHQNLDLEKKKEHTIDPNSNLLDQILKKHPDFIALENQLNELQSLLISKIEKANVTLEEVAKAKPAAPVVKSGLETRHNLIHCRNCHNSPIIGKRYACIQCPSFNLCEECHILTPQHQHRMIVLAEEGTNVEVVGNIYSALSQVSANPTDTCIQAKMDILKLFTGNAIGNSFANYFLDGRESMPNAEFLKGVCDFFK